jgi:hypothetical protein
MIQSVIYTAVANRATYRQLWSREEQEMFMNSLLPPMTIQVSINGEITLSHDQVARLGLLKGERLLVLPVQPDQFLLIKLDLPDTISAEVVSQIMREAFHQAGYTTRDHVIQLFDITS